MLREFDEHDWDAFAGAEPISGTQEPLIYRGLEVTDWPEEERYQNTTQTYRPTLIVDDFGVSLTGIDKFTMRVTDTFHVARAIAEDMIRRSPLTIAQLECYGFNLNDLDFQPSVTWGQWPAHGG